MKKKFIFLMMLLTILGGVSINSLRAQETITIGSGTEVQAFIPLNTNYDNTISEHCSSLCSKWDIFLMFSVKCSIRSI